MDKIHQYVGGLCGLSDSDRHRAGTLAIRLDVSLRLAICAQEWHADVRRPALEALCKVAEAGEGNRSRWDSKYVPYPSTVSTGVRFHGNCREP